VTWPDPELDAGAAVDFSPPEPEAEPEPELLEPELPEPELLEPEADEPEWHELEAARPCFAPVPDVLPCAAAEEAAGWACAALARPTAMPPPARTLAAPMAAVTARRRPWPRSRAAAAAWTLSLPVSTPDHPSAARRRGPAPSRQHARPTSAPPLRALRACCGQGRHRPGCGQPCG
jgi:hypothetical protein